MRLITGGTAGFRPLRGAVQPIRTSATVESPDVIVVFHEALLNDPATLAGIRAAGTLIFTGPAGHLPARLARLPSTAGVIRVDAQWIAAEEGSRPNAVLIGTLAAVLPFLESDILLEALSAEFAHKRPEAVANNERAFRRGAREFEDLPQVGEAPRGLSRLTRLCSRVLRAAAPRDQRRSPRDQQQPRAREL